MLDGDYELIVFRFKADFLRECTQTLSSHGARDVKCVDAREGSIIVDVGGSKAAVDAAVAEVVANGLDLPSFGKLALRGMTEAIVRVSVSVSFEHVVPLVFCRIYSNVHCSPNQCAHTA